ncbi:MAG: DNA polymerase IV [Acidimicrobiia bacterium]|nr:DNA polymerase IV [Acidimicrobiia bacterium]
MRRWLVAGGLVEQGSELLLVRNRRRSGVVDWSPPGGVVDPGESLLEGLTREVEEETGLRVTSWDGPVYEIRAEAPGLGWHLRVEVHRAVVFQGELGPVVDPDGIVDDARWVPVEACDEHLRGVTLGSRAARRVAPRPVRAAPHLRVPGRRRPTRRSRRHPSVSGDWPTDARSILHVDMDAFFVSVELLRRPELRGRPVVVGGAGDRGVVAAASYEARAHGIHSAMPSVRARRLCPHAVFLHGDLRRYTAVSRRVMELFGTFTPWVEPLSLDEAFLDVSGVRRLHGPAPSVAAEIRAAVREEEGLPCSVGVATTKFVAKLASQDAKPRPSTGGPERGVGVRVVAPGTELAYLRPLPVERLWGVGPKTLGRLGRLGITTVADLADTPLDALVAVVGPATAEHLRALADGEDERPVVGDRAARSVGHEETFRHDHHDPASLRREAVRMSDAVAQRLRRAGIAGRTVTVKVRFADFGTITRAATEPAPLDTATGIGRVAKELLADVDPTPGVRLLGVSVSNLDAGAGRQLRLDDTDRAAWDGAAGAVDAIRDRFGDDAIGPAASAGPGARRPRRPGAQPSGPDEEPPASPAGDVGT